MADILTTRVEGDPILAKHNEIVDMVNEGTGVVELTEAEIVALVTAGKKVRAYNTDTGQVEYWRSLTEVIVLG